MSEELYYIELIELINYLPGFQALCLDW